MAARYTVKKDVFLVGRDGRKRFFSINKKNRDGTVGYTDEDLKGLTRDQLTFFTKMEVSGGDIVEQATQAPGEKRARKPRVEDE